MNRNSANQMPIPLVFAIIVFAVGLFTYENFFPPKEIPVDEATRIAIELSMGHLRATGPGDIIRYKDNRYEVVTSYDLRADAVSTRDGLLQTAVRKSVKEIAPNVECVYKQIERLDYNHAACMFARQVAGLSTNPSAR